MHHSILLRRGSGRCQVVQEKAMPSFSFQFCIFLTPIITGQLLWQMFATLLWYFSAISEAENQNRNHRYFSSQFLEGAEISSDLRGFSHFYELILLASCVLFVVLLPTTCPAAKYPIPTSKYHTYLWRAVPTSNDACAGEMGLSFSPER